MPRTIIPDDVISTDSSVIAELEALFAAEAADIDRSVHEKHRYDSTAALNRRKGGDRILLESIRERRMKGGLRADTEFLMHLFNL